MARLLPALFCALLITACVAADRSQSEYDTNEDEAVNLSVEATPSVQVTPLEALDTGQPEALPMPTDEPQDGDGPDPGQPEPMSLEPGVDREVGGG